MATTKTTKTNNKPFPPMSKTENDDFNLGKQHAWEESPKIDNGSPKYHAGYNHAAKIVNRLRVVYIAFAEGTDAEIEGREAGMLEDRGGCTYQAGTQEYREWVKGFNAITKARTQHKQMLDGGLSKEARLNRKVAWRMEEEKVLGLASCTMRPFDMSEEEEAARRELLHPLFA
jgi:hypothetical protein